MRTVQVPLSMPEDREVSYLTLDVGTGRADQGRAVTVELEEVGVEGEGYKKQTGLGGPGSAMPQKPC